MKKKLLVLTLICFLLSLTCGCAREVPEYLPGLNEGDSGFVWVCKEPFGFFYPSDDFESEWGLLKGHMWKEDKFVCLYSAFLPCGQRTEFMEEKKWGDTSTYDSFWGTADYYKNGFYLEIEGDLINFFDGELPKLRFDKMTKEDFLLQYGDIENISELLE